MKVKTLIFKDSKQFACIKEATKEITVGKLPMVFSEVITKEMLILWLNGMDLGQLELVDADFDFEVS